jgi:hypothetical protein
MSTLKCGQQILQNFYKNAPIIMESHLSLQLTKITVSVGVTSSCDQLKLPAPAPAVVIFQEAHYTVDCECLS